MLPSFPLEPLELFKTFRAFRDCDKYLLLYNNNLEDRKCKIKKDCAKRGRSGGEAGEAETDLNLKIKPTPHNANIIFTY